MSASGIGHGRGHRFGNTARVLLWALSGLLAVGMAGSLMMSLRAGSDARREIVEQAATIAERSLTLAFVPEDLEGPVDPERATELSQRITAVVLDPSDFTTVTLYGADGTILYTTDLSRIGTQLVGEQERIQEALKGIPQNREEGGTFSTMQSFRFPSGVGRPAVVELARDADPIGAAVSPWRTMALFLFVILVLLMLVAWGVARITAATTTAGAAAADAPRPQQLMPATRQGARSAPRAAPAAAPAEERRPGL
ncbi:MAG TPA: hypothetical protein VF044_10135, partial [Actinomycetota bacterium]